jgi:hypothetical protein
MMRYFCLKWEKQTRTVYSAWTSWTNVYFRIRRTYECVWAHVGLCIGHLQNCSSFFYAKNTSMLGKFIVTARDQCLCRNICVFMLV